MAKNESFNFRWKLTENYFNLFIVLVGALLLIYAIVYNNTTSAVIAILWGLTAPFIATLIDKKSHEKVKRL